MTTFDPITHARGRLRDFEYLRERCQSASWRAHHTRQIAYWRDYLGLPPEVVEEQEPEFTFEMAQTFNRWGAFLEYLSVAYTAQAGVIKVPDTGYWLIPMNSAPGPIEFGAARQRGGRGVLVTGFPKRKRFGVWLFSEKGDFIVNRVDFKALVLANVTGKSLGTIARAVQ